jgi:hypothetical protein
MRIIPTLSLFLGTLLASHAFAQTAAEQAACKADFEKYCAGTMPGGGRVLACLEKQLDKLSPDCKKVVETHAK